jgi:aspartate racemase
MKTVGIIGGIGPESTIEYYRQLMAAYREQRPDGSAPSIIINSIDMKKMLGMIAANELVEVAGYLAGEVQRLARAGAECGLLASNTPHIVFDEIGRQSPIPLISIVQSACAEAKTLGLAKLGLFGTRFTMQGRFYPDVFLPQGIALAVPNESEQTYIHDKYMNELLNSIFLPETRARLLGIVDRLMEQEHIQGLVLGGTELPLILRDATYRGIPLLDTTRIHVKALLAQLLA